MRTLPPTDGPQGNTLDLIRDLVDRAVDDFDDASHLRLNGFTDGDVATFHAKVGQVNLWLDRCQANADEGGS